MAKTSPQPEERDVKAGWCFKCDAPRTFLPFFTGTGHFCNQCGQILGQKKVIQEEAISGIDIYTEPDGTRIRTLVVGHLNNKGYFVQEKIVISKWRS